jgi:hypothetical protein
MKRKHGTRIHVGPQANPQKADADIGNLVANKPLGNEFIDKLVRGSYTNFEVQGGDIYSSTSGKPNLRYAGHFKAGPGMPKEEIYCGGVYLGKITLEGKVYGSDGTRELGQIKITEIGASPKKVSAIEANDGTLHQIDGLGSFLDRANRSV